MSDDKPPALLETRAERIRYAVVELEKTTLGKVERALGFSDGDLSKYASGKRGGSTVDVDKMVALANHLHVRFEWLVRGEGPARPGGRDTTPAEEAIFLARRSGTREEAIQSAWARFQDRAATMTALDWAVVIHNEALSFGPPSAQRGEALATTDRPARVDATPPPKGAKRKRPPQRPSGEQ